MNSASMIKLTSVLHCNGVYSYIEIVLTSRNKGIKGIRCPIMIKYSAKINFIRVSNGK